MTEQKPEEQTPDETPDEAKGPDVAHVIMGLIPHFLSAVRKSKEENPATLVLRGLTLLIGNGLEAIRDAREQYPYLVDEKAKPQVLAEINESVERVEALRVMREEFETIMHGPSRLEDDEDLNNTEDDRL